jgi:replication factor A1
MTLYPPNQPGNPHAVNQPAVNQPAVNQPSMNAAPNQTNQYQFQQNNQNQFNQPYGTSAKPESSNYHYDNNRSNFNSNVAEKITPIEHLSPYNNNWTIKARVTSKSDLRTWSNAKGEGKLFSVNLLDNTGEIKATAFNDVAEKYFNVFEVNKVYTLQKALVKVANKMYSNLKNDYEISMDHNTIVQLVRDDSGNVPTIQYKFVPINEIENTEKDAIIDVIGVVIDGGELATITMKTTQKQMQKRDILISDDTQTSVRLTLWGKQATDVLNLDSNPVIVVKSARVSDYNGRTLTTLSSSTVVYDPDIPKAHTIKGWYESAGKNQTLNSITASSNKEGQTFERPAYTEDRKTLFQIREEGLGASEKVNSKLYNYIARLL